MLHPAPGVLVADQFSDLSVEREALPGVEVEECPPVTDVALTLVHLMAALERRPMPVIVIGSGVVLERAALEALADRGVRGIVCASVGYNHVDTAAAAALRITVCNVPDYGTDDVADHAMALLLWCLRGLARVTPPTGDFWAAQHGVLRRLSACTLALLGFGRIGQAVARRAQAFGLAVRWYDPYVPRGQDKVTRTRRVEEPDGVARRRRRTEYPLPAQRGDARHDRCRRAGPAAGPRRAGQHRARPYRG